MLLRTPIQTPLTSPLAIEAESQIYKHAVHLFYLGGRINETADTMPMSNDGSDLVGHASIG